MKKIDLHIHTIASPVKDSSFDFDIEKLISYVKSESLDAIAITNHNLFDYNQYRNIIDKFETEDVKTKVFPGVEIDLENGHILYITDVDKVNELVESCTKLNSEIVKETDSINFNRFVQIFPNFGDALLIPHGEGKKPILASNVVKKFSQHISTVEVPNQKKFMTLKKSNDSRTPVLFSDVRISDSLDVFPKRCTYVDVGEISISSLKATLSDKLKVHISNNLEREGTFEIDDLGTEASVGLNVVLGARATGKTFLMDKIAKAFPNTKYIKQFQLMSDETKSDETFQSNRNKWLNNESSKFLRDYSNTVSLISSINTDYNDVDLKTFVESLLGNASDLEINDEFSKCKLFNADKLQEVNLVKLKTIIEAINILLNPADEYKDLISSYTNQYKLQELIVILITSYEALVLEKYIIGETNKIIDEVKEGLKQKTSVTQISNFDEIKYCNGQVFLEHSCINRSTYF